MTTMAPRRIASRTPVRSRRSDRCRRPTRSSVGMTRSLHTMVLSATVSTMIMPVAAESPPMKASSAIVC